MLNWLFSVFSSPKLSDHCFLALETTGLHPNEGHRIIEFAFLKTASTTNKTDSCFIIADLVNPEGKKSDEDAQALHRISARDLKNASTFSEHIASILEFVGERKVVAHYSRFHEDFLKAEFERVGKVFPFVFVDSVELVKGKLPNLATYDLPTLTRACGIKTAKLYRAENDVQLLYQLIRNTDLIKAA